MLATVGMTFSLYSGKIPGKLYHYPFARALVSLYACAL
jgi:hypothetical protein